jgi:hypothetical protein
MENQNEAQNPFLQQEDYFAGYKKNIEAMRNDPALIELDKLFFELFSMNEQGKRFMEIVKDRWLYPALARPGTATYQIDVIWGEGFKDFPRMILMGIETHLQRIKAGTT